MATRTFAVLGDARVGTDGSLNLGAGACDHLPVGEGGGYQYRSFIKFDVDWSGMTDVSSVKLYLTNDDDSSSSDHLVRGASSTDRKFYVDRVTEGWSEGTESHPMTSSNGSISSGGDMVWPGPTCSTSGTSRAGPFTASNTNNDQQNWDITDLAKSWGPTTVYFSGASTPGYGSGNTHYGIRLIREDAADSVEFWSSDKGGSGNVPKIVVTYTNNSRPTCVITSPIGGATVTGGTTYATPTVTVGVTCTDPDGDSITGIQIEFSTTGGGGFTTLITSSADDDVAGVVSRAIASATLTRGVTWYVRAKCSDATGYGSYSAIESFRINNATAPVIAGTAATVMEGTVEGSDTGPRAVVRFTYSDPEGQLISRYTAGLYSDSGGTTLLGTLVDVSTTTAPTYVKSDYTGLVHGTTYYWFVQTWDADGLSTGRVSQARVAKWAVREEYLAVSSPSAWSTNTVKVEGTDTRAVVQHGVQTAGAAGTDPSNWTTDLSSLSPSGATYYWSRYWLFAWNGAATSTVSIQSHTLTYTSSSLTADGWTLGSGASITTSRSWYGTRCLRIDGTGGGGTTRSASISVPGFKVGETYTISCRIFQSGVASAFLRLMNGSTSIRSAGLVDVGVADGTTAEFVYTWDTYEGVPAETLTIQCDMTGAAGTYALFDAIKVEQGSVATPWTPAVLSRAVVVDGNGVQVDGRGGGIVRFRGSDISSSEAEVDIIDRGLRFSSPLTLKEISAPSNPSSGFRRLYLKSDGLLYLKNSGGTETPVDSTDVVAKSLIDAKGDLLVGSAADTAARLAVGTDGYILRSRAAASNGIDWMLPRQLVALPFIFAANITASSTNVGRLGDVGVFTNHDRLRVPWAGSIAAISYKGTTTTAGTITFSAEINSVATSVTSGALAAGGINAKTVAANILTTAPFVADDQICMTAVTSAGFTPTTNQYKGILWLLVELPITG